MSKKLKTLVAGLCLILAATSARGDGAAFARATGASMRLDTRTGTRLAATGASETIAYSPRWARDGEGAAATSCSVTADGTTLKTASDEGEAAWSPTATGAHTLTHTAGDVAYTAQFTVLGDDVAQHAGALAASETWASNTVHLVTADVTVPSGKTLTIEPGAVVKFMTGTLLTATGTCMANGVIFTHVNDDTAGGDTLMDGDATKPVMDGYKLSGNIYEDDATEERYTASQTLSSSISGTLRLKGHKVYLANSSITVNSGATLTLLPGAIIKFASGCSMTVNGTLDAQGTRAAPIVFTSAKDDEWGGDTNGDGDATYAQAGDWHQITGSGTVKMNYCQVLWCSAQNNQGGLFPNGGTWSFDNSIVAHCQYDCMRSYGGTFNANNSVFMDSSMGAAPSSGTCRFANCVFYYLTTAVRWGCGSYYNCIFANIAEDIIDTKFYSSTVNSPFGHCCFWAPNVTGDKASAKVGKDGNIWADPKFLDPDNGDFRIAADSPCVDAGDGTVAPELDYWGQPRMDVKRVKDTGVPNADGVCPDIGIYEVPGMAVVPMPDLAVLSVSGPATAVPGEEIAVTYVVTNRGAAAVYDGYLKDAEGSVKGTVLVKVAKGKVNKKTGVFSAKVTATVQLADGSKKLSFKGGFADERGLVSSMAINGHALDVTLDGSSAIDGARNLFSAKAVAEKAAGTATLNIWKGAINVVADGVALSVTVANKGKVKVAGTVNGVKVSATSQLQIGEEWCCIPAAITKKASLAFNLWLPKAGGEVMVAGLDGAIAGKAGALKGGSVFRCGEGASELAKALSGVGATLLGDYLPEGVGVAQSGAKWVVADGAKAGKVAFVKGTTEVDAAKAGANPSGLKLTYKAKDGSFKGSFKAPAVVNGKIKSYTVNVAGVLVNGVGYGTATLKKPACSWDVRVE